ncbi:MAG: hypothetical protein H6739_02230 [Alphaproteobacteria bacterium]|nr:hypothetical protein [Alphaproteobacteria bacterium]
MRAPWILLPLLGFGCDRQDPISLPPTGSGPVDEVDQDGDGSPADEDCDDHDPRATPGAAEVCDGADNDCDGEIDEPDALDAQTWYADFDDDSFGDEDVSLQACERPVQYVSVAGDCDDERAWISPAAREVCNEEDDDCDAAVDEELMLHQSLVTIHSGLREVFQVQPENGQHFRLSEIEERLTPYEFSSLASDPGSADGTVYAYDSAEGHLYYFDPCNGTGWGVGPVDSGRLCGISFGVDSRLFGLDVDNDTLVEISTVDGSTEVIGLLDIDIDDCGVAFSCVKQRMYGVELPGGNLFQVNLDTGKAQELIPLAVPMTSPGLAYHLEEQTLYLGTGTELHLLDPDTGEAEILGSLVDSDDLAWVPECGVNPPADQDPSP